MDMSAQERCRRQDEDDRRLGKYKHVRWPALKFSQAAIATNGGCDFVNGTSNPLRE